MLHRPPVERVGVDRSASEDCPQPSTGGQQPCSSHARQPPLTIKFWQARRRDALPAVAIPAHGSLPAALGQGSSAEVSCRGAGAPPDQRGVGAGSERACQQAQQEIFDSQFEDTASDAVSRALQDTSRSQPL